MSTMTTLLCRVCMFLCACVCVCVDRVVLWFPYSVLYMCLMWSAICEVMNFPRARSKESLGQCSQPLQLVLGTSRTLSN